MIADASAYAANPWLALYGDGQPAEIALPARDVLGSFSAHARATPSALAIRYFDVSLCYAEIDRLSDAFAAWLQQACVAPAERVFVSLQNVPQFFFVILGCWKAGVVPVVGNPMYTSNELGKLFEDCAPKVVVCAADQLAEVRAAVDSHVIVVTTSPSAFKVPLEPGETQWSRGADHGADELLCMLHRDEPPSPVAVAESRDGIALLLYTSGTTGKPKGAMISHANLAFVAELSRGWFGLDASSRILAVAPLFHITGFALHFCLGMTAGASVVVLDRFAPERALEAIRKHRPTFTIGATTVFIALMNAAGATADDMRSFEAVYSGGAPIPPTLVGQFERKMGKKIYSSFGMTETTAPTHLAPRGQSIPVDEASGALSIGVPVSNVEACVIDESGNPCAVGEAGEIVVRGPQVMAGYWNKPEETATALAGGWMHTGDIGVMDNAGWFYLIDRKKDMINASGFKVWPREVEDVLYRHDAVREAAVVGIADSYRGESVKAFVSLKKGQSLTPDELVAFARTQLAAYKCPREVEIRDDLPKTATGKLMRHALRPSTPGSDVFVAPLPGGVSPTGRKGNVRQGVAK